MDNNYTKINADKISGFIINDEDGSDLAISFLKNKDSFRPFKDGLKELFRMKNIDIDLSDNEVMADFLYSKLKDIKANIEKETVISWFSGTHRPKVEAGSRLKMYEICFALNLNETETTWFFQHIYYDRAFNCHTIDEAVFYFAFSNGLTYQKSLNIIKKINEADAPAATNYEGNYTLFVKNQINSMKTAGELTTFLISNKENFKSWNKSAGNMLKSLAAEITIPESAKKKTDELKRNISRFLSAPSDKTSCKKNNFSGKIHPEDYTDCGLIVREIIYDSMHNSYDTISQCEYIKDVMNNRNFMKNASILRYLITTSVGAGKDTSIPYIVRNNFPSKKTMSDILSEDKLSTSKSYDSIRKLIILLDFYRFWVNAKLNSETEYYKTLDEDKLTEIYIEEANNCLYDCGYEDLYAGNPYDWIFLCSAHANDPLDFFRSCFSELLPEE